MADHQLVAKLGVLRAGSLIQCDTTLNHDQYEMLNADESSLGLIWINIFNVVNVGLVSIP